MAGRELRYDADGLSMIGSLCRPASPRKAASGKTPGVLVFPEAFGLSAHALERAERIADELGYVALACDLWGERRQVTAMDQVMPMLGALTSDIPGLQDRVSAPLKALRAQEGVDGERIAAIGFCFGGTIAFELATCSDIKAAIGFHSGMKVPSLAAGGADGVAATKILAMIGQDDPAIAPDSRAEFIRVLTEAKADWQVTLYGGVVHSFTNPDVDAMGMPQVLRYDARADRRSWAQMTGLMEEVFG
ncbi:MAG TPA: dienelactone hydrolase family protein [Caulobacteraceae bacterium]|jgi:dienelactone hydrolase